MDSKDVKLSNIARSLNEEEALIKTEDRLSRNLDDVDFTDGINDEICRLGASRVLEDMVIAIDPGDITKKYAKKMEFLASVHVYCEAYSQNATDFKSENDQLFKVIDAVGKHAGSRGIWAIDRGGDRGKIYDKFLEEANKNCFKEIFWSADVFQLCHG